MDDWRSWTKDPPDGHEFVEWARLHHREGLMASKVSRVADLHAAWDGKQWNLAAIFWRPAKSAEVIDLHQSSLPRRSTQP
jgi:hypothetical protein